MPRAAALRVVITANFSLVYINPGPNLKVSLSASDITSGELVDGGVLGLATRGQKLLK